MVQSKAEDHGPLQKKRPPSLKIDKWTENVEEMFGDRALPTPIPDVIPGCQVVLLGPCAQDSQGNKAAVPLSEQSLEFLDDDDPAVKSTHCDKCANCPTCKLSSRARTQSLQESSEQELPNSQDSAPETGEEQHMVVDEIFLDAENVVLEAEAKECLVICDVATHKDQCDFPHLTDPPDVAPPSAAPEAESIVTNEEKTALDVNTDGVNQSSPDTIRAIWKGVLQWLEGCLKYLWFGWAFALQILLVVIIATLLFRLGIHQNNQPAVGCGMCDGQLDLETSRRALHCVSLTASAQDKQRLCIPKLLERFTQRESIWYSSVRLEKEGLIEMADLDFNVFFSAASIKKVLSIILVDSRLFRAFVFHTHFKELLHRGVEATLTWIKQTIFPYGDARRLVAAMKKSCFKCRILLKQVVSLESDMDPSRIHLLVLKIEKWTRSTYKIHHVSQAGRTLILRAVRHSSLVYKTDEILPMS
jgi:hypothetical protein